MQIPWHLVGATLHNLVTALALAPSCHSSMNLKDRCTNSLSGFLLLDLFEMVADQKCKQMGLPTSSCFLAKQTIYNMQCVALTTSIMCLCLPQNWNPWQKQARITEIAIEQHFGHLRGMSATAQLSARSYMYASARQSMKIGKILNRLKAGAQPCVNHLSDEELLGREFNHPFL